MPRPHDLVLALALGATSLAASPLAATAQTLTIGVRAGPESMDPDFTATGTHAEAAKHIFDTLVWSGDQLQLEPRLALSWTAIDTTTWEFKLRPNVKFHDGSDFTAEDVKFSIERVPTVSGPNPTTPYVRRVKAMTIIDPLTIRITTEGPAPSMPNDFVRLFIVSHIAAAGLTRDNANEAFNTGKATIGTGPFKFVSWTPKSELVLERFDGFWGGPAPWQKVVRKEIPNDAARVAQLKAGQVDMIVRVPAADVATLKRDPKLDVITGDTIYVFGVELDQRERSPQITGKDGAPLAANPFRDPKVREAISLAIDRPTLVDIAMEGLGSPASQNVTPGIFGYDPKLPALKPDLARAKALLAEAGYPNGFKVTLSFTSDRLPGDRAVGTSIAQMLARIGIDAQPNAQPTAVFFPTRTRGEYSMIMAGWGTLTGESHYTLSSLMQTADAAKKTGAFNWRQSSNPALDTLLDQAGIELDEGKRRALLQQAMGISVRDHYVIPTVIVGTAWALQKKITLVKPRADEDTLAYDVRPTAK